MFQVLLCQIEIVWVFSGSIPVLMVLAGQWAWDCKSSFVRWAWALWTVNPNGVSGSIPLMNESETERKKMQVKRDENPRLGTCICPAKTRSCLVFSASFTSPAKPVYLSSSHFRAFELLPLYLSTVTQSVKY